MQIWAQKDHYLTRYESSKVSQIFSIFLVYLEYFCNIRSLGDLNSGQILTIKIYGVAGALLWDSFTLLSTLEYIFLIIWSKNENKNDFFSPKYHIFESNIQKFQPPKSLPKGCSKRVLGKLRVDLESKGKLKSIRAIRSSKRSLFDEIRVFKVFPNFFHFPGIFGIFLQY